MTQSESAGEDFAKYVIHLANGTVDVAFELDNGKEETSDFNETEFVAGAIVAFKSELVAYLHLRDED